MPKCCHISAHIIFKVTLARKFTVKGKIQGFLSWFPTSVYSKCSQLKQYITQCMLHWPRKLSFPAAKSVICEFICVKEELQAVSTWVTTGVLPLKNRACPLCFCFAQRLSKAHTQWILVHVGAASTSRQAEVSSLSQFSDHWGFSLLQLATFTPYTDCTAICRVVNLPFNVRKLLNLQLVRNDLLGRILSLSYCF